jgi:hypothetical protein
MKRLFVVITLACSCNNPNMGTPPTGDMAGMGNNPDLAPPPGTQLRDLIESDFSLSPGDEYYQCQRVTLKEDVFIVRMTPVSPLGVHHQVLAIDPSPGADGTTNSMGGDCSPTDTDWVPFFASGVGSDTITLPPGVAYKATKGQQLVFNLHLYNATNSKLEGKAVMQVALAIDGSSYQPAGFPYVGNPIFTNIGPSLTVQGTCTVDKDTTIFAVFPHMHQSGKHMKIAVGSTVVWDADFNFNEQKFGFYPNWLGPETVVAKKGEKITVTCTYHPGAESKGFGDSSDQEMCFGFTFLYPPIGTAFGTPFCYP